MTAARLRARLLRGTLGWPFAREVRSCSAIRLQDSGSGDFHGRALRSARLDFEGEPVVANGDLIVVAERYAGPDACALDACAVALIAYR